MHGVYLNIHITYTPLTGVTFATIPKFQRYMHTLKLITQDASLFLVLGFRPQQLSLLDLLGVLQRVHCARVVILG